MAIHKLDVVGEVCPIPLLKTQRKFQELQPGDILVVETDFSRSVRNIIEWAERKGIKFTLEDLENGVWQIYLTR